MSKNLEQFRAVKTIVQKWVEKSENYFADKAIHVEVLRNEPDGYVASFENDACMAEVVVEEPYFAPYRFISFEVAAIENDHARIIYSWYDSERTKEVEIEEQLKRGIESFVEYKQNHTQND